VNREKLSADFFILFQHEGVETKLVAPTRCGQASRTGADDENVMHAI